MSTKPTDAGRLQIEASARRADYRAVQSDYRSALETHRTLDARYAALSASGREVPRQALAAAQRDVRAAAAGLEGALAALGPAERAFNDVRYDMCRIPPQQAAQACDDHFPFLLFPVRLECRFAAGPSGSHLKLRIFPDRAAIDNLDELLTVEEIAAAETFWTGIWRAGGSAELELAAWRELINAFGPNRAAWIARSHVPSNEKRGDGASNRPGAPLEAGAALDPAPLFPAAIGRLLSWSRAPRAFAMPDWFVALGYVGDQRVFEVTGAPIPETLMTGPDPLSEDDANVEAAAEAADTPGVDAGMKWMVDFDTAVGVGMAMTIALPPEAADGLDELVVLGLKSSADAGEGAQVAEAMVRTHLYGPDGFSFVPQGTPTNDVGPPAPPGAAQDAAEAAYAREFKPAPPPPPPDDWQATTDGRHFAVALGIDPAVVHPAANSEGLDQADAHAMNVALWPATMGPFLEEMMSPLLNLGTIKQTQRLFTAHVSGRGPVPAIRIGDQPYGVAVTSVLSRWTPDKVRRFPPHGALVDDAFRTGLHDLLMRLDAVWEGFASGIAALGDGQDAQATLLDVLGLLPRSAEYYQRFATSLDQLGNAQSITGLGSVYQALAKIMHAKSQSVLTALGIDPAKTPDIYRRIFYDSANKLKAPFVDAAPLSEQAGLAAITDSGQNYLGWLASRDIDTIRREDFGTLDGKAIPPPTALLYLLLRQAVLNAYWDTGWNFFDSAGLATETLRTEAVLMNIQQGVQTPSKYQLLYQDSAPLAQAYPNVFRPGLTVAEAISNPRWNALTQTAELAAVRVACDWLSGRPTAKSARAGAEHLDLCSYRLDGWRFALVNERLADLRTRQDSKRGLYIGAFGYLETLKPRPPSQPYQGPLPAELAPSDGQLAATLQEEAEHILAPSLTHAVTAAVLRNAYRTHAGPGRPETMSIDISSARVRGALDLLDGVRSGQGVAELLGYRFERGLHDRHAQAEVDMFIYPLREKFPLVSGQLVPTPPGVAIQAVEARNVLDGQALVRHMQMTGKTEYPFGFTGAGKLPDASAGQQAAINAEAANLIDMLDSVADLMLAEGAYGAAMGNLERAGAALDAISGAKTIPEPEIVRTKRSGHGLTHRLCLLLPAAPPSPAGEGEPDFTASPRARMEPALNAWLAGLFGPLDDVLCRTRWVDGHSEAQFDLPLSALRIEPIDLLHMAEPSAESAAGELDMRIALAVRELDPPGLGADIRVAYAEPIAGAITLFELLPMIRAVKALLLGRRPLGARDFAPPSQEPPAANPNGWLVDAYESRVVAAGRTLAALYGALADAAEAVEAEGRAAADFRTLATLLLSAAGYGIPGALPAGTGGSDAAAAAILVGQAARVQAAIWDRLLAAKAAGEAAAGLDENGKVAQWTAAAKAIFGADFIALPGFMLASPGEIALSAGERASLLRHAVTTDPFPLETWLAGIARVRPAEAHLERILTLAPALRRAEPEMVPLQLPYREGDYWQGTILPPGYAYGPDRLLATTIFADPGELGASQAGLLLDEWTEVIPVPEQTAAVTFRYDAPASEPPQALLLAVTPEITGAWAWDDLVDTVRETIRMARHRAVEPRQIDLSDFAQLLPAIMVPFTATGQSIGVNVGNVTAFNINLPAGD